jgi:pilus assembly protein CpaF
MPDTIDALAQPPYLDAEGDIVVWKALEAATGQVREVVADRFLAHGIDTELDAAIRDDLIPRALAEQERRLPPGAKLPPFAAQVLFSILRGYAELDPLFLDPEVSEIVVDGPGQEVYVERHGLLEGTGLVLSRDRIRYLIERMGATRGQFLSEAQPVLEIRLPLARATAVHERLALGGPSLVLRLHGRKRLERQELIDLGTIPEALLDALAAAFTGGANILIAGEVSSGKTTLLQTLLAALPAARRVITIEDPIEIALARARMTQLEVRHPNSEGIGAFTQRELVRLSLRLRPDHLVVGEVRDGAAWDMVDAMSLGHNGSITTIHAGATAPALMRLESLCLRAGDVPSLSAVRRAVAEAVNLVVQMQRVPALVNGRPAIRRVVTEIAEVTGLAHPGVPGAVYHLIPLATRRADTLEATGRAISASLADRLRGHGIGMVFEAPLSLHGSQTPLV